MTNAIYALQEPLNEPIYSYSPGTAERVAITSKLKELREQRIEIPVIIGGKEVHTGLTAPCVIPHNHQHPLGFFHHAGEEEVGMAVTAALDASRAWAGVPWQARLAIFLKAAELLAGPYRDVLNAATMLGQSKTCHQAEIDSAAETIDFFRFNAHYYAEVLTEQPESGPGMWNRMEHRPLEGFVFAVSPFNFTAIASNLAAAPALCGNTVLWKPASTALFSAHHLMRLYRDAGMPDGVINMIPGSGRAIGDVVLNHPDLAGIHFTGSTGVFNGMWRTVGQNLEKYRSYPRLVGETGGKDFIFAHPSADPKALTTAILRGAFEYQGQKCSAASRAYVPSNLWAKIKDELLSEVESMKMGDPRTSRTSWARSSTRGRSRNTPRRSTRRRPRPTRRSSRAARTTPRRAGSSARRSSRRSTPRTTR
jgi:1-pyrroline-5-carboxylate dehydrogenase